MKWIIVLSLFFYLFFFSNYTPLYFIKEEREWRKKQKEEKEAIAEYSIYVAEIRSVFAKKMKEKLQLEPTGQSGMMHRTIEMMGMYFDAHH